MLYNGTIIKADIELVVLKWYDRIGSRLKKAYFYCFINCMMRIYYFQVYIAIYSYAY